MYCGVDCAGRPRTKNAKGQYACNACLEARKAQSAEHQPAPSPAPEPDSEPIDLAVPEDVGEQATPKEDNIYQVVDSADGWLGAPPKPCPGCSNTMASGSVVCTHCGYDLRTGTQINTGIESSERGPLCAKCGYDLKGLRNLRCPECGTKNRPPTRSDIARRESDEIAKQEYLRPLIYLAIGTIGTVGIQLARGETSVLIFFPIALIVSTLAGFVAFYVMSAIMWGFDAPVGLIMVRLLGIFALCELAQTIGALSGLGIISWMLRVLVFYSLIMKEFDVDDVRDVWFMTIIMQIVSIAVLIGVASLF